MYCIVLTLFSLRVLGLMTPRVYSVGKKYLTLFVASSTDDETCSWLNGTSSMPNRALKLLNKPHWYVMYAYNIFVTCLDTQL